MKFSKEFVDNLTEEKINSMSRNDFLNFESHLYKDINGSIYIDTYKVKNIAAAERIWNTIQYIRIIENFCKE